MGKKAKKITEKAPSRRRAKTLTLPPLEPTWYERFWQFILEWRLASAFSSVAGRCRAVSADQLISWCFSQSTSPFMASGPAQIYLFQRSKHTSIPPSSPIYDHTYSATFAEAYNISPEQYTRDGALPATTASTYAEFFGILSPPLNVIATTHRPLTLNKLRLLHAIEYRRQRRNSNFLKTYDLGL